jgi:hypothetical protein
MTATTFIGHFLGPDIHANRPAAAGLPNGTMYVCTTDNKIERVVSGAWVDYATLGSSGAAGALTLLSTTTLASAGTFDVSGISGAYNDLVLVLIARGVASANQDTLTINFNNDTGANYQRGDIRESGGTTPSGAELHSGTNIALVYVPAATAPANAFGVLEMRIYGYASTVWLKSFNFDLESLISGAAVPITRGGGTWSSTSAITRVQIAGTTTANLAIGSQLRIYGRT